MNDPVILQQISQKTFSFTKMKYKILSKLFYKVVKNSTILTAIQEKL